MRSSCYPGASAPWTSCSTHGPRVISACTTNPSCRWTPLGITKACGCGCADCSTAATSRKRRWTGWCWSIRWVPQWRRAHPPEVSGKAPRGNEGSVSDHDGGARAAVRLTDIASRVPGVLADMPAIVRGALTGLLAQPGSRKSIGTVFQERAARYGDRVFLRFGDQQLTYRDANAAANRYAAVLAARGVGSGDVVAIMLRNSPNAVLAMLAAVKCGAVAAMINYHQRGEVLAHSLGLLDAKVLIAETDLVSAVAECGGTGATETLTVEDLERFAASAPASNPASASAVQARDTAFYIFTSGTTD